MKKMTISAACLILSFFAALLVMQARPFDAGAQDGQPGPEEPAAKVLSSPAQKAGYAYGFSIGQRIRDDLDLVDIECLVEGLRHGAGGIAPRMDEEAVSAEMKNLNGVISRRSAERTRKEGADFLAANAKKEGVLTTPSGLQYRVITEGKGRKPGPASMVTVHYEGRLLDGTVFDSTYKRGQPTQFPLNRVIPGWSEGLQLMSEGSKYEIFVPANLGYGARGAGGVIPPNATLIFTVELLEVK